MLGDTEKLIFVVGANRLQNELIASFLQDKTGHPCSAAEDLTQIAKAAHGANNGLCLALYDCLNKEGKKPLAELAGTDGNPALNLGLFNLERNWGHEKEAMAMGIKGFFYRGDCFDVLIKGVDVIFNGDLWVSRQILQRIIEKETNPMPRKQDHRLSDREKEILSLLAVGASNDEIAEKLFISRFTVKNHLQNIFKKIGVHGKIEAAIWASRNLNP